MLAVIDTPPHAHWDSRMRATNCIGFDIAREISASSGQGDCSFKLHTSLRCHVVNNFFVIYFVIYGIVGATKCWVALSFFAIYLEAAIRRDVLREVQSRRHPVIIYGEKTWTDRVGRRKGSAETIKWRWFFGRVVLEDLFELEWSHWIDLVGRYKIRAETIKWRYFFGQVVLEVPFELEWSHWTSQVGGQKWSVGG